MIFFSFSAETKIEVNKNQIEKNWTKIEKVIFLDFRSIFCRKRKLFLDFFVLESLREKKENNDEDNEWLKMKMVSCFLLLDLNLCNLPPIFRYRVMLGVFQKSYIPVKMKKNPQIFSKICKSRSTLRFYFAGFLADRMQFSMTSFFCIDPSRWSWWRPTGWFRISFYVFAAFQKILVLKRSWAKSCDWFIGENLLNLKNMTKVNRVVLRNWRRRRRRRRRLRLSGVAAFLVVVLWTRT